MMLLGDCRDVVASMPDASVDCIVTDPPYGETSLDWDRRVAGWLPKMRRLLKPHGSLWCFGSMRFFIERADDFSGWRLAQEVVWEKHNGSGFAADRFKRVHEIVSHFYPTGVQWRDLHRSPQFTMDATRRRVTRRVKPPHTGAIGDSFYSSEDGGPRLMRSVIYARSCHGSAVHPTQKPVEILKPLIAYSCPPGGVVLDPFAGSGSTGVAALGLGRRFIGIEVEPRYHAIAESRLRV